MSELVDQRPLVQGGECTSVPGRRNCQTAPKVTEKLHSNCHHLIDMLTEFGQNHTHSAVF